MNDLDRPPFAATDLDASYRTARIGGRKLAYLDVGTGFPVVLGHSYLWDAAMWRPQVEALSARFRVIVPDLWGHGRSDPPPAGTHGIDDLAEHYLALLDSLDIDECHVVGLSVGGMWGEALARRAPRRVRKLVLMDTFLGAEPALSHAKYFGMLMAIERERVLGDDMLDAVVPMFFSPGIERASALYQDFRAALAGISQERLLDSIVPLGRIIFGRADRLERLRELDPERTLVVAGQFDIPRPVTEAAHMASIIGCAVAMVANAGHISNLENPRAVNRILMEFLSDGN